MKPVKLMATAALCYGALMAQAPADHPFTGSWILQNEPSLKLIVEQNDQKIHVREMKGQEVTAEYTCGLDGKECEFKQEGHPAKVSLWFNGPKLVELRSRGNQVTRRRFSFAPDGKSLNVELSEFSPNEKHEMLAYSRQ